MQTLARHPDPHTCVVAHDVNCDKIALASIGVITRTEYF